VRRPFFWIGLVGLVVAIPLGWWLAHPRPRLPVLGEIPRFALTDQDGRPFDDARLRGRVTIVNFVFTTCPTVCPTLSAKMARLQRETRAQLLSISVDPTSDTPPVLKAYGAKFAQDPARWSFVTGSYEAVERAVVDGFHVFMGREPRDAGGGFDVVHGEKFALVDGAGRIRGYYDAIDADLARLVRDAGGLE
jgi:protein SCO1/2